MKKIVSAEWIPGQHLVVTRLSGILNGADILQWKNALDVTGLQLPGNYEFKILVDLYDFKAENFEVHKQFRNIMPLFLAEYGYRAGYLGLFPEAQIELKNTRGIQCKAMANVHHDETKMNDYNDRFSNAHERYFTDPVAALQWILSV